MTKKPAKPVISDEIKRKYYKSKQYGVVFGIDTVTPVGRLSWPHLVKPKPGKKDEKTGEQGKAKYEFEIILDKNDPKVEVYLNTIQVQIDEMLPWFNEGRPAAISALDVFKDGDAFDHEKSPHYKNTWVLKAKNEVLPEMYSLDKEENGKFKTFEAGDFKGGMLVRAVVSPLISGYGVSFKVKQLQFVRDDGTRFNSGVNLLSESADNLFDELPSLESDSDDMSLEEAAAKL